MSRSLLLLLLFGSQMLAAQEISPLGEQDIAALNAQRQLVQYFLPAGDHSTVPSKLGALRALLDARQFRLDQTYELQAMGVVLGDVFVQELEFKWVMVSDEYGRDPALQYQNSSLLLFPLTMISKRIESGETVDVFTLYNGIADHTRQRIQALQ
ncbi:DUF3806 domain-containing protein [Vogesella indigofera]|uniref:DUF3806 domain-containing protein n=1 Tax=Vogesella indigofera TaxID=45465 RepID=UPI00234E88A4|nr:DUF3806 domain-containing protein [Vogesella indigofera]MDC7701386.1 DUF3806 domain-containing protein [Vogesella indigofera]